MRYYAAPSLLGYHVWDAHTDQYGPPMSATLAIKLARYYNIHNMFKRNA